jgi:hypothetical protein
MQRGRDATEGVAAYELADVFCQQARLRVERLFDALFSNTDDADHALAVSTLDGKYAWLEAGIIDPSEGTGPWIATWEPGPSTEDNMGRRYLPSTREEPKKPATPRKRTAKASGSTP